MNSEERQIEREQLQAVQGRERWLKTRDFIMHNAAGSSSILNHMIQSQLTTLCESTQKGLEKLSLIFSNDDGIIPGKVGGLLAGGDIAVTIVEDAYTNVAAAKYNMTRCNLISRCTELLVSRLANVVLTTPAAALIARQEQFQSWAATSTQRKDVVDRLTLMGTPVIQKRYIALDAAEKVNAYAEEAVLVVLAEMLISGLLEARLVKRRRSTKVVITIPPALLKTINSDKLSERFSTAVKKPMLTPPRKWTQTEDGGYLSKKQMPLSFIAGISHSECKRRRELCSTAVLASINTAQETPWRINKRVAQLIRLAAQQADRFPNLFVTLDDIELPSQTEESKADPDGDEFLQIKRKRGYIYNLNETNRSARYRQYAILNDIIENENEAAIYFPHHFDTRGRIYPTSASGVSPQGDKMGKATLEFSKGVALGTAGMGHLSEKLADAYGEKGTIADMRTWAVRNIELLEALYDDVEGFLTVLNDMPDPYGFVNALSDFICAYRSDDPASYISHCCVNKDGTINGMQHICALSLDAVGGAKVNLTPSLITEPKADAYQEVADASVAAMQAILNLPFEEHAALCTSSVTADDADFDVAVIGIRQAELDRRVWQRLLKEGINRKTVKNLVMTIPYGAGKRAMCLRVEDAILDAWRALGFNFAAHFKCSYRVIGSSIHRAARIMIKQTEELLPSAGRFKTYIEAIARTVKDNDEGIHWISPIGFPVVCRKMLEDKVRMQDRQIKKMNLTLYHLVPSKRVAACKQKSGAMANLIHSLDAACLSLTLNTMADMGVTDFSCIHDSYGTHAGHADLLSSVIRKSFIGLYEADPLAAYVAQLAEYAVIKESTETPLLMKGSLDLSAIASNPYFFS